MLTPIPTNQKTGKPRTTLPENFRRSGGDVISVPLVRPTGWHRSMPGEARRVPLKPSDVFPVFKLPENWKSYVAPELAEALPDPSQKMEFVKALAWTGAFWRYADGPCRILLGEESGTWGTKSAELPAAVTDRLLHELSIVSEVGYEDYFLIVWDICCHAAQRKIPFLARGSAADSLLCYVMGISTVCPLRFQLYFERFLNPERMKFSKLADIDLDFPWDQRDEIMQYVFDRWGHDHVAMIGGFSRYHGRMAVADLGKVLGLSEYEVRQFTKRLPRVSASKIAEALDENILMKEVPTHEEPYPEIIRMAKMLDDLPRHSMMHPCGIVISREPLRRVVPLQPSGRGPQMTQYDMDAVEDLGLVKIDLLGQAGLSVLRDVLDRLEKQTGQRIELDRLPWDDDLTWEMIATGGARGVHHIESPAMTTLLVQSNCRDMDCLCAIVSVIRPGAADEQKKLFFTRRHQGFEPPVYPHPSLEPHLKDTYGLLIFEEHILMVAHHFAGMNLGVSDVLRRELVKMKNPEKLIELGYEFRDHALALGRTEDEIRQVWRTLVAFHGYMFNKAHSASYAVEAWHGAWLKARHPALYMAAVLSNQRGFYTPLFYSMECRRLGIGFLLPDINEPSASYEAIGTPPHSIRLPVVAIKGLSAKSLKKWQSALTNRPFSSALDFARRVRPTSAEISLWIDAGTLDHLPLTPPEATTTTTTTASPTPPTPPLASRPALFWFLKQIIAHLPQEGGEGDLFESLSELDPGGMLPPTLSSIDPIGQARREWELFDFPVTLDPFTTLGKSIAWHTYCPIGKLGHFHGQNVTVCGIVVQTRRNHTLRGEVMQFFTLADATGFVECTVFPKTYRRSGHHVLTGRLISVHGTVDPFENHRGQTIDVLRVEGAADLRVD